MKTVKIAAVVLIILGALALFYGGFSYMKQTGDLKIGSLQISLDERQTVNIPVWLGVGAIVVGGLMIAFGDKRR